jgi:hypothetical protein
MVMGRPSKYSEELAERICTEIANGKPVFAICQEDWCPSEFTIYKWLRDKEDFSKAYAHAREIQQERFAAEVIAIADTEKDPAIARNRMDARKWYAGKVSPKKWGDRVDIDAKVEVNSGPSENLMALLAMAEKNGKSN